jgi:hypothetical protein
MAGRSLLEAVVNVESLEKELKKGNRQLMLAAFIGGYIELATLGLIDLCSNHKSRTPLQPGWWLGVQ